MTTPEENEIFQKIYIDYQPTLRQYARSLMVPSSEIDDIIQETFIAYFNQYRLTWTTTRKKGLLVKILRGKSIDYLRKSGRHSEVSFEENIRLYSERPDPVDYVMGKDAMKLILSEIDNMERDKREIAILYFLEQWSIPEICAALNITETVCNSRVYRIRNRLKKVLIKYNGLSVP